MCLGKMSFFSFQDLKQSKLQADQAPSNTGCPRRARAFNWTCARLAWPLEGGLAHRMCREAQPSPPPAARALSGTRPGARGPPGRRAAACSGRALCSARNPGSARRAPGRPRSCGGSRAPRHSGGRRAAGGGVLGAPLPGRGVTQPLSGGGSACAAAQGARRFGPAARPLVGLGLRAWPGAWGLLPPEQPRPGACVLVLRCILALFLNRGLP